MFILCFAYLIQGCDTEPKQLEIFTDPMINVQAKQKTSPTFDLSDNDLINEHYNVSEFIGDSVGRYNVGDDWFEVEIGGVSKFEYRGEFIALVFFENYEISLYGHRLICFGCSGYIGIGEYHYKDNHWQPRKFTKNCNCGGSVNGRTDKPDLVSIFGYYFLEQSSFVSHQGYSYEFVRLYNIEDYGLSIEVITSHENSGAAKSDSDFYSTRREVNYSVENNLLSVQVKTSGTRRNEFGEIVQAQGIENYLFDEKTKTFVSSDTMKNSHN